jgi:hypothetical protein
MKVSATCRVVVYRMQKSEEFGIYNAHKVKKVKRYLFVCKELVVLVLSLTDV